MQVINNEPWPKCGNFTPIELPGCAKCQYGFTFDHNRADTALFLAQLCQPTKHSLSHPATTARAELSVKNPTSVLLYYHETSEKGLSRGSWARYGLLLAGY